jgi:cytidine deaminase
MNPALQSLPDQLRDTALAMRERAYAPFSKFLVGAAILSVDGRIYGGCNIENASFGATICAERVAGGTAIAEGDRQWSAIAVATAGGVSPCGICRQFLAEFSPQMIVWMIDAESGRVVQRSVDQLLPDRFLFTGP